MSDHQNSAVSMEDPISINMSINGQSVKGARTFDVINPATEEIIGHAPECTREQLDMAMETAQAAFRDWRTNMDARRDALRKCAERLRENTEELARILTLEQGKPLAKARRELGGSAAWFEYTAGLEFPSETIEAEGQEKIEVRRRPHGVVGAITPWNYPVILAVWKVAPALLAGNTVVLKPSPYTPLSSLKLGEMFRDILPPGVLNIVTGGDALGEWITSHPAVRKISFTGSIETGKKVSMSAAPDLKRVTLELGGNDPAIILPDADPKALAEKLFWAAFENTGQVCTVVKRMYIHESLYAPLVEELASFTRGIKMGNGLDEDTELGPLNNKMQFEKVMDLIDDAKKQGGKFVTGGDRQGDKGYFITPSLVTELADDSRLVTEEQFGPVLPLMTYKDIDEVVERANSTMFGLSASIWSSDSDQAAEIAGRIDSGMVWVNQHLNILPQVPMGGLKWSGIGVENGPWGLLGFTDIQVVEVAK